MPHQNMEFVLKQARAFKTERTKQLFYLEEEKKGHHCLHNKMNADGNIQFEDKLIPYGTSKVGQIT